MVYASRLRRSTTVAKLLAVAFALAAVPASGADEQPASPPGEVPAVLTITGVVRDAFVGRPISGAKVTVHREIGKAPEQRSVKRFDLVTDADGRYSFDWRTDDAQNPPEDQKGNDSQFFSFYIVATCSDHFPGKLRSSVPLVPRATSYPDGFARRSFSDDRASRRLESIGLRPGKSVTGVVQTEDGKPLAGVKVVAHSRAPNLVDMTVEVDSPGAPRPTTRVVTPPPVTDDALTDESGRFTVTMVTPGLGMLSIEPEKDYAPAKHFAYDQRGDIGIIKLRRGAVIRGMLLDADGKPHAKVQVNADPWNLAEPRIRDRYNDQYSFDEEIDAHALTDAEGNFTLSRLPAADYRVEPVGHGKSIPENGRYHWEFPVPGVFVPQKVKLADGEDPPILQLRAVPTVTIEGHASLQATSGAGETRSGRLSFRGGGGPTVQGIYGGQPFGATLTTDNDGNFSAEVPKGMNETVIELPSLGDRGSLGSVVTQIQWRLGPDARLQSASRIRLGTLDKDFRDLEIVQVQRQRTVEEMQQLLQAEVEAGRMNADQAAAMLQSYQRRAATQPPAAPAVRGVPAPAAAKGRTSGGTATAAGG